MNQSEGVILVLVIQKEIKQVRIVQKLAQFQDLLVKHIIKNVLIFIVKEQITNMMMVYVMIIMKLNIGEDKK